MKVNIDFKRTEEQVKAATNQFLVRDYIEYAISKTYPNGLKGQLLRVCSRIQRKLDEAVNDNLEEVNFEQAEMDFIKDVMDKTEFSSQISRYVVLLEDELNKK